MSTSTLKFYKNTPILPNKNFMVDGIEGYLGFNYEHANQNNYFSITDFQYIKHALNLDIKIDSEQTDLEFLLAKGWNYMSIKNSDSSRIVYYFIVNKEWRAQNTIKMTLFLDTLNTFKYEVDYTLSEKTKVLREHKDRFERLTRLNSYTPIIPSDQYQYGGSYSGISLYIGNTFVTGLGTIWNVRFDTQIASQGYDLTDIKKWAYTYKDLNTFGNIHNFYSMIIQGIKPISRNSNISIEVTLLVKGTDVTSAFTDLKFALEVNYLNRGNADYIAPKVDYFNEGLNPILYKKSEDVLIQNETYPYSWNLTYKGSQAVDCYLIPDISLRTIYSSTTDITFSTTDLTDDNYYWIQYGDNNEVMYSETVFEPSDVIIEVDGVQYTPKYDSTLAWSQIRTGYMFIKNGNSINFYQLVQKLNRFTNEWEKDTSLLTNTTSSIKILNRRRIYYSVSANPPTAKYIQGLSYKSQTSTQTGYLVKGIQQIDRTDSTLIKIIKLPYSPVKYNFTTSAFGDLNFAFNSSYWKFDPLYSSFKLNGETNELSTEVITNVDGFYKDLLIPVWKFKNSSVGDYKEKFPSISYLDKRSINYESKLYHSSFYQKKFVYDSFSFVYQYEKIDVQGLYDYLDNQFNRVGQDGVIPYYSYEEVPFRFTFTATQTINSKFMFSFPDYILKLSEEDYDNILPVARNNELVIYNSDYINYLRTAYNYDLKAKERTEKLAGLQFGLSTGVGAIRTASTFLINPSAGVLSLGGAFSSTLMGITQLTNTIAQAEDSVERKITAAKHQAISVAGSDDVDLLLKYSDNKAKLCTYQASDRVREMLYDLFFFTGYATGEMKVPDLSTRLYFNFIQAEIVFRENRANIPQSLLDNIAERFASGVTNIHNHYNDSSDSYLRMVWEFTQTYENWELSLLKSLGINWINS